MTAAPRLSCGLILVLIGIAAAQPQGNSRDQRGVQPDKAAEHSLSSDTHLELDGTFFGNAISYSGYRRGQSPDSGIRPTKQQIAEDLRILERNWQIIRIYGSGQYGEDILKVIRSKKIRLKVLLGAWLAKEPGHEDTNANEVENCIRLANEFPKIVVAVNVGNEALVSWTAHPVPEAKVIEYVRRIKASISAPVTVADNYAWWRDEGARIAKEVDFLMVHTYPAWERKDIDEALAYTIENYEGVSRALPGKPIIIGEAGWPTYTEGNLHVPRAGDEKKQQRYFQELTAWAKQNKIPVFFFSAFDEPWKGTGTEGHWGMFSVDRKAKLAMASLYPELVTSEPTSPAYPDEPPGPHGPDLAMAFRRNLAEKIGAGTVNPHGPGVLAASVTEFTNGIDGNKALRFAHTGSDWGGVYLLFNSVDVTQHSSLVLSLQIPIEVAALDVKVEGPPTQADTVNLLDHERGTAVDGWRTFAIPLADLDGVDLSQIAIIGLWNPRDKAGAFVAGEVIVDDIHFE